MSTKQPTTLDYDQIPYDKLQARETLNLGALRRRSLTLAAACTFTCLLIFSGGGYLLDFLVDKKPFFFIIGLVLAFIFTNISVIYLGKQFNKKE